MKVKDLQDALEGIPENFDVVLGLGGMPDEQMKQLGLAPHGEHRGGGATLFTLSRPDTTYQLVKLEA